MRDSSSPVPLRVVVLEDNPRDAELNLRELRKAGFAPDAVLVDNERDFLAALDPAPELILADYGLPQFDGVRALQLVKDRGLDIPFILVSGTLGEELAVSTLKRGADDYLLKGSLARLGSAAEAALNAKRLRDERRAVDQELRVREERYRLLFERHPHPAWIYDRETLAFLAVNDAAVERYGFSRAEFLSMTLRDIRPPEDIPKLLATPGSQRVALWRHRLRNGEIIRVEISSLNLEFDGRSATMVLAIDVTERLRAAEQIQSQLQELLRWKSVTLGREDRIRELKQEVNELLREAGREPRYADSPAEIPVPRG